MCRNLQGLNSHCLTVAWKAAEKDTEWEVAYNHSATFYEIKWGDFPSRWRRKHTCKGWTSAIIWHSLLPALKPAGTLHFFQSLFCVTAEKQHTVLKLRSCTFPPAHVLTWLDYFWFIKNWRTGFIHLHVFTFQSCCMTYFPSLYLSLSCVIVLRLFKNWHTLCTLPLGQPGLFSCLDHSLGCHSADRSPECRSKINPISPIRNNGWTRADQNTFWKGLI